MDSSAPNTANEQRNSTSSATSAGSPRRASAGTGLFAAIQDQKRSNDPAQIARRQSMHDQRRTPGFLCKMWSNFVHGTGPSK